MASVIGAICFLNGIFFIVSLFAFLLITITIWLAYRHKQYAHIPGPKRDSFYFGVISSIKYWTQSGKKSIAEVFYEWILEYGPVVCIWFFHRPIVMISDPHLVRDIIINKNLRKPKAVYGQISYLFGKRFMGEGLVTEVDHYKWQKKRKTINPAFFRSSLKSLMSQYNASADKYVRKLCTLADGATEVNMALEFHRVALDVIAKVAFGLELNTMHDAHLVNAVDMAFDGVSKIFRSPLWKIDVRMYPFQNKVHDAVNALRKLGKQSILEKKRLLANGESSSANDILTMIVKDTALESETDIEELVDEFVTFIVAGQETTANMISFLLIELLKNAEFQERLTAEIDEVLGSREFIEYEDLGKFQFLGQLIKETLRLYPPAPQVSRETTEKINIGGYDIPSGTSIQINIFAVQRNAKYWPNPETFDPDRWSSGSMAEGGSNIAYIPFMLGPRNCIGQFFAQFEAKVLLARFWQQFKAKIVTDHQTGIDQIATLRPRGGVPVILTKREQ